MTGLDLAGDAAALAGVDDRFGGLSLAEPTAEVWGGGYAGLIRLVLGQLVSIEAADAMWANLNDALGEVTPDTVRAAEWPTLKRCGFTARKAEYARAIADRTDVDLDFSALDRLGDDEIVARLIELPGIGTWTAECYLLFCLGRRDVFPAGDLALRVGWQEIAGLDEPPGEAALREAAARWSPYRTTAAHLIWSRYLAARGRLSA